MMQRAPVTHLISHQVCEGLAEDHDVLSLLVGM